MCGVLFLSHQLMCQPPFCPFHLSFFSFSHSFVCGANNQSLQVRKNRNSVPNKGIFSKVQKAARILHTLGKV